MFSGQRLGPQGRGTSGTAQTLLFLSLQQHHKLLFNPQGQDMCLTAYGLMVCQPLLHNPLKAVGMGF